MLVKKYIVVWKEYVHIHILPTWAKGKIEFFMFVSY
jgi:hypothetical protein